MRMLRMGLLLAVVSSAVLAEPPALQTCAIPGWRLALQAYTFNKLTLVDTIDRCRELGIEYLEAFPGQKIAADIDERFGPGASEAGQQRVLDKCAATGIKIVQYGVTGIPGDEAAARKMYEWAKRFGILAFSTEVAPQQFELVDKLGAEYGIRAAIHNHPKPSRYWDPQVMLDALGDRYPHLGACADTGHWSRSELVPLECLKKIEGRIVSLHFKDLNVALQPKGAYDLPWGTGALNARTMLEELRRQKFQGTFSIEYEKWDAEQVANVRKCVEWFFQTCTDLAKAP